MADMNDSPSLLNTLAEAIDRFAVPLIILWFTVRWFALVPDDEEHSKAREATRQGGIAGLVGAAFLTLVVHAYGMPQDSACELGCSAIIGAGLGAVVGLLMRFYVPGLKGKGDDDKPGRRGFVVFAAVSIGLASLLLYLSYPGQPSVRQWLMWSFVSLLLFYRLSLLLGDRP
jgi:UDP-N-acetylmuramyl pentapeptide phosphotransferase/UDP-N-acetylglucosamine-1-phosphate transferase